MNGRLFQIHIRQLAEQAVPDDVDLWPAIRTQLSISRKVDIAIKPLNFQRRLRTLTVSVLVTLLFLVVILATPWGQALAQSLFRFFSVAPAESFPLPTEQNQLYGAEPTKPPTFAVQLQPLAPAPIETGEAATLAPPASAEPVIFGCDDSLSLLTYRCQVSKAEAAVGFDLKEPPGDLQGLFFSRAEANPTLHSASLLYAAIGGGSQLTISQVRGDMAASSWGEVPPGAAVEKVRVGENDGEYVRGAFVVKPGAASAAWQADSPVQRLRWREGDVLFEIRLDGEVWRVEYLEKDTLVALAESLVYKPNLAEDQLRADYLTRVEDAEALAGFDVLEPTMLPEDFSFNHAEFESTSQQVRLVYEAGTGGGTAGIVIYQTSLTDAPEFDLTAGFPLDVVETVRVGGIIAQSVAGAYFTEYAPTPGSPTATPVWNPNDPSRSLIWRTSTLSVEIYYFSSQWYGGRLDKSGLIALAESMK